MSMLLTKPVEACSTIPWGSHHTAWLVGLDVLSHNLAERGVSNDTGKKRHKAQPAHKSRISTTTPTHSLIWEVMFQIQVARVSATTGSTRVELIWTMAILNSDCKISNSLVQFPKR